MTTNPLNDTQFESPADSAAADWIEPELTGKFGTVGGLVPSRYQSFIRIFHPATTSDGKPATWSQVAKAMGRTMHPCVQWHALLGSSDPEEFSGSEWSGGYPERGELPAELFKALCAALGSEAARCYFGVDIGWTAASLAVSWKQDEPTKVGTTEWRGADVPGAHFELPHGSGREFLLVRGPLNAVAEIAEAIGQGDLGSLVHLVWPPDHSWYLATDVDFDSSILGGSVELLNRVASSAGVEALQVNLDDSLTADADYVNSPLQE